MMSSSLLVLLIIFGLTASLAVGTSAVTAQADDKYPIVIIDTSAGPITVELDREKAPITVENFLKYVDSKFFDDLIFHRVIKGFMIQGGGFDAQMQQKREGVRSAIQNESGNGLSNQRGTIAMARTSDPNSATCQFFINHVDNPNLDTGAGYAVFGKVRQGMDVVDKIAGVETTRRAGMSDVPVEPITIKSVRRKTKS
jgi:cyclophilin family peptidyl-prolyl cis-trans isomerase